jgi:ribonuclease P protein component
VLREVWRRVAPSVAQAHVVIVAREGILEARTDEVEREMRELLGRVLESAG